MVRFIISNPYLLNMENKICSGCGIEKPKDDFYTRPNRKTQTHSMCKKCFNNYCSDRWIQKKIDSIKYKGSECVDCGLKYPDEPYVIFDFHHTNPKNKDVDWGKLRLKAPNKIYEEIDKCDLLCSNCHRKRHYFKNL